MGKDRTNSTALDASAGRNSPSPLRHQEHVSHFGNPQRGHEGLIKFQTMFPQMNVDLRAEPVGGTNSIRI